MKLFNYKTQALQIFPKSGIRFFHYIRIFNVNMFSTKCKWCKAERHAMVVIGGNG